MQSMKKLLLSICLLPLCQMLLAGSIRIYNKVEGGFVIVSENGGVERVIGYSDRGFVDSLHLSPAMKDWLESMELQDSLVRQGSVVPHRANRRAAVVPMLTTRWGQRWPYNRMAPEYAEGSNCAAGCVAVAMAQVLKYWASSMPALAIPAYQTETLGIQLDALPSRSFNYSIMKDEYGMFDWDESAQEVATLMRYCGQAAEMDYDVNSGTETSGKYLANFFGFKNNYEDKNYLTHTSGLDELIYGELAAGRPVLYSGRKMNNIFSYSGHVFVVDGCDADGLFHINWGWDGSDNGYFELSSANGYHLLPLAVIGLEPVTATRISSPLSKPQSAVSCYDLQGRRVGQPKEKGIYIVNGKKVVIR